MSENNESQGDVVSPQDTASQFTILDNKENENKHTSVSRKTKKKSRTTPALKVDADDSDVELPQEVQAAIKANMVRRLQTVHIAHGDSQQNDRRHAEIKQLQEELQEENARLKKRIADLKQEIENLTEKSDNAKHEINRLKQQIEDDRMNSEKRIEQLQRKHRMDFEESRRRVEELQDENQALKNEMSRLHRENQQLQFEVDELTKEKIRLEKEVENLKIQLNDLQRKYNEMRKEMDETKKELNETKCNLDIVIRETTKDREQKGIEAMRNNSKKLMGEVAFKFDRVVIRHIFQDRFDRSDPNYQKWKRRAYSLTINHVLDKVIEPMTTEENKRLEDFVLYLQNSGWYDGKHFTSVLQQLKDGRFSLAHLSPDDKHDQDRTKLKKAAACADNTNQTLEYQYIIDDLCDFTKTEYPLRD